jgi:SAM-dependent methyltransferase
MERHRFQWQILSDLSPASSRPQQALLHFAPEPSLEDRLRPQFGEYISADLFRSNVDQRVDVRDMPFSDGTFDIILCSMVLHYVDDYKRALQEIYRVLKPGGFALLPVPMIHEKTNHSPVQNSALRMVVEPGPDFYDLYYEYFDELTVSVSTDYDDDLHFFLEPTDEHPFPLKLAEQKHADIIPVSFKAGATLDG